MNAVQRLGSIFVALWVLTPALRADDKKVQTVKGWGEVADPDGDCTVAEKDGKLTITVPGKYHDLWVDKGKVNAPRVLQEVEGDFSVQVLVTGIIHPEKGTLIPDIASTSPYQSGGLVIWKDEHTLVRLERAGMVRANNGDFSSYCYLQAFADNVRYAEPKKKKLINAGKAFDEKDTLLRLERKEGKIFAASSQDGGKSWRDLPDSGFAMDLPAKLKVGVTAIQSTTKDFTAEFRDFKVAALQGDAPAKKLEAAPAKKLQDEIVGTWASKSDGKDVFMTFTKDGGYEVAVGDKSFKGGTFQLLDDATIETKMNDQTTKLKLSLSGDTLVFEIKGTKNTFERVKDKESKRDKPEEAFQRGVDDFYMLDLAKAKAAFSEAIAHDTKNVQAYVFRARVQRMAKDLSAASDDCENAILLDGKCADAFVERGRILASVERHDEAVADLSKAIELDAKCVSAYYFRGLERNLKGDKDGAKSDFAKAAGGDASDAYTYNTRSAAHAAAGDFRAAIKDCDDAIKLRNDFIWAYTNRAVDLKRLPAVDWKQVIEDYSRALQINPNHFGAYFTRVDRGDAYVSYATSSIDVDPAPHFDAAMLDFKAAIDLDPKNSLAYGRRGMAIQTKVLHTAGKDPAKDLGPAIDDLSKAIELCSDKPLLAEYYADRGGVQFDRKDWNQCVADSNKAEELNPKLSYVFLTNRGRALLHLGKDSEAQKDLDKFVELFPNQKEKVDKQIKTIKDARKGESEKKP